MINERLSKLWHREDLRGFLGGMRQWIWEGGVARVVSEEGVTGKACSSQMRNGAVTCGWPRMAVGGWQAHMQKASAQAQVWHWQGSKRCLSLWEDSQGHGLCWQFSQPSWVNCFVAGSTEVCQEGPQWMQTVPDKFLAWSRSVGAAVDLICRLTLQWKITFG